MGARRPDIGDEQEVVDLLEKKKQPTKAMSTAIIVRMRRWRSSRR
jgi:hypothetical protein